MAETMTEIGNLYAIIDKTQAEIKRLQVILNETLAKQKKLYDALEQQQQKDKRFDCTLCNTHCVSQAALNNHKATLKHKNAEALVIKSKQ